MQTHKTTYQKINIFVQVAQQLLRKKDKKDGDLVLSEKSKLRYAILRVTQKCMDLLTDYNEQNEDLLVKFASVDDKGDMVKEPNGVEYKFSPKNKTEYNAAQRELFRKKEVDAPQYIATEIPEWLEEDTKMVFDGFVLNYEEKEPEEEPSTATD